MAVAQHKRHEFAQKLCLSCCAPMDVGFCLACWERQSRHLHHSPERARHYCPSCGQWREVGAGHCECGETTR